MPPVEAKLAAAAAAERIGVTKVAAGEIVALRGLKSGRDDDRLHLVQASVYAPSAYRGSIAEDDQSNWVVSADPWFGEDLFGRARQAEAGAQARKFRRLDAIYSAGLRGGVPTNVLGEAIVHLSRSFDLNALAQAGEEVTLVYTDGLPAVPAEADGTASAARVLYAAIRTERETLACFVFPREDGTFGCGEGTRAAPGGMNGMVTPVDGVLTSRFGPRKHPCSASSGSTPASTGPRRSERPSRPPMPARSPSRPSRAATATSSGSATARTGRRSTPTSPASAPPPSRVGPSRPAR